MERHTLREVQIRRLMLVGLGWVVVGVLVGFLFLQGGLVGSWASAVALGLVIVGVGMGCFALSWLYRSGDSVIQNLQAAVLVGVFAGGPFLANYAIGRQREREAERRVDDERRIVRNREKEELLRTAANDIPRILATTVQLEHEKLWMSVESRQPQSADLYAEYLSVEARLIDQRDIFGRSYDQVAASFLDLRQRLAREPNYLAVCTLIRARYGPEVDRRAELLCELFDLLTELTLDEARLKWSLNRIEQMSLEIKLLRPKPRPAESEKDNPLLWVNIMRARIALAGPAIPDGVVTPNEPDRTRLAEAMWLEWETWEAEIPDKRQTDEARALFKPANRLRQRACEEAANHLIEALRRAIDIVYLDMLHHMEEELSLEAAASAVHGAAASEHRP